MRGGCWEVSQGREPCVHGGLSLPAPSLSAHAGITHMCRHTHTVALACVICDLLVYPCPHRHHAGPNG